MRGRSKPEAIALLREAVCGHAPRDHVDAIRHEFEGRSMRFYAHDPSVREVDGATGVTSGSHSRRELESDPHTHLVHSIRDLPGLLGIEAD